MVRRKILQGSKKGKLHGIQPPPHPLFKRGFYSVHNQGEGFVEHGDAQIHIELSTIKYDFIYVVPNTPYNKIFLKADLSRSHPSIQKHFN